jgi:hypothetical protein
MPAKQTKESIETELDASAKARVARKLHDAAQDAQEFEMRMQELEAEAGLPAFYQSKPVVERMAALGMSQDLIDHARTRLDALSKVVSGRSDELPEHFKAELAADRRRRIDRRRSVGGYRSSPSEGLTGSRRILL